LFLESAYPEIMAENPEPQRFFVVGDVHGCPRQLEEILTKAQAYPRHRLVFLGDYIDRGPDSETVLQLLRTVDGVFLLGNHEQMLIDRWNASSSPSVGRGWLDVAHISLESFEWLVSVALDHYETDDYLFVHGGLDPRKPRSAQTKDDYLWVRHDGDYLGVTPKVVVHGHHSVDKPVRVGNRININTRCGVGGPLTALVLPEYRYHQSSPSPVPRARNLPTAADLAALADEGLEEL
jgi:serine/threonine protein phosphatase 1